jgi:hypothetical protein
MAGVVCRSLDHKTALGIMEDHNRLLPATESRSGQANVAVRDRGVLVLACVLVALVSLLCLGKESLAKQPGKAPRPGSPATSHRPAGAPNADHQAPATRPEPAHRGPVDRGPSSRPTHQRPTEKPSGAQRPTERTTPVGWRAPGPRHSAEPPGRQSVPHQRPTHEPRPVPGQRPVHEQKPVTEPRPVYEKPRHEPKPVHERPVHEPRPGHERPGLQEPVPQGPAGPDHARHHPHPEKVDRGPSSRPVHEKLRPQTRPNYPHGKGSAGQQEEGVGSPDLHGKPASPPDKENIHPQKRGSVRPPEQIRQRPEQGMAVGPKPDKISGNEAYKRANPEEKRPVYRHPARAGTPVAPDGRSTSTGSIGAKETAGRRPSLRTVAGHETGSDAAWGAEPSHSQARAEDGISGPRSVDLRGEEPTGPSSAHPPDHQAVRSSPAFDPAPGRDALPAAPSGEKQRPVGEQAQLVVSGTPFGSTKLLLDPLWDERGSLISMTQEALRSVPGGLHDFSRGTLYRGSLTQRGPPLEIPSPFVGFISMLVGAGSGSSGSGIAPLLLAVIAPCLMVVFYRGRSRIIHTLVRPVTVPRPALERPG